MPPTPPLAGAPLGELKQWLAITTDTDDALLIRLMEAAWQACAQFTGHGATEWSALDTALRHGIVRLAAHHYRERDNGPTGHMPTAIAALWRPWRMVRL